MFNPSSHKMLKQFWGLISYKWAFACFSLLTLQQIIEASSTIWLVLLMNRITTGDNFFPYLYLYLITLVIPYIPGCLAYIFKITWKQEAQRSFINSFVTSNQSQIADWNNRGIREEKLSILTAEGPSALHALIDYIFDLFGYILSVFLNILSLSIVVEPLFSLAYGFSVAAVLVVMKFKKRIQQRLTQKALTARVDLYQSLLASWDNVLLGNRYNFKLWEDRTNQRLKRCLQKNVDLERFDQILAIVICLMTSIPSLIVVIHYVNIHQHDRTALASFLVTLSVLFWILYYTYQTLSLMFIWGVHRSKLASIYKAIQPTPASVLALEKKVKWQKIHLNFSTIAPENQMSMPGPHLISSHHELLPHTKQSGRITLRGENGAGKSTLLILIKHALADRAFFLPTQNHLFFSSETNKYSTGESLKNRLIEILEKVEVDVLLLDEWDANLDNENQEKLSILIDELATKKCVIEVRHR
jgi:ABC-type transport system involved in cytochrome bd biosynthesis fused ATPase/permease subunit